MQTFNESRVIYFSEAFGSEISHQSENIPSNWVDPQHEYWEKIKVNNETVLSAITSDTLNTQITTIENIDITVKSGDSLSSILKNKAKITGKYLLMALIHLKLEENINVDLLEIGEKIIVQKSGNSVSIQIGENKTVPLFPSLGKETASVKAEDRLVVDGVDVSYSDEPNTDIVVEDTDPTSTDSNNNIFINIEGDNSISDSIAKPKAVGSADSLPAFKTRVEQMSQDEILEELETLAQPFDFSKTLKELKSAKTLTQDIQTGRSVMKNFSNFNPGLTWNNDVKANLSALNALSNDTEERVRKKVLKKLQNILVYYLGAIDEVTIFLGDTPVKNEEQNAAKLILYKQRILLEALQKNTNKYQKDIS